MLSFLTDVDECDDNNNGGCTSNSNCVNMLGTFECQCERGYEMMNGNCIGMKFAEFNFNGNFFLRTSLFFWQVIGKMYFLGLNEVTDVR